MVWEFFFVQVGPKAYLDCHLMIENPEKYDLISLSHHFLQHWAPITGMSQPLSKLELQMLLFTLRLLTIARMKTLPLFSGYGNPTTAICLMNLCFFDLLSSVPETSWDGWLYLPSRNIFEAIDTLECNPWLRALGGSCFRYAVLRIRNDEALPLILV